MSASDPTKTLEDELPDEEPTVAEVKSISDILLQCLIHDFPFGLTTLFFVALKPVHRDSNDRYS